MTGFFLCRQEENNNKILNKLCWQGGVNIKTNRQLQGHREKDVTKKILHVFCVCICEVLCHSFYASPYFSRSPPISLIISTRWHISGPTALNISSPRLTLSPSPHHHYKMTPDWPNCIEYFPPPTWPSPSPHLTLQSPPHYLTYRCHLIVHLIVTVTKCVCVWGGGAQMGRVKW